MKPCKTRQVQARLGLEAQSVLHSARWAQGPSRIVYAPLDYCQIAAARNRFACCAQNRESTHREPL